MSTRTYRGITLNVTSEIQRSVTVETITFEVNGKDFQFIGAYGNAQSACERAIMDELGVRFCPRCQDESNGLCRHCQEAIWKSPLSNDPWNFAA